MHDDAIVPAAKRLYMTATPRLFKPVAADAVYFLAADGVELVELTEPWHAVQQAGGSVQLVSLFTGEIQGMHHDRKADMFRVDKVIEDADASDYDGLVLPGGVMNPDLLRVHADAIALIRAFHAAAKPVAAVCHAPWLLIEAGLAKGLRATSYGSIKTDMINAGVQWVDQSAVEHRGIITSRDPDDLPDFVDAIVLAVESGVTAEAA